MKTNPVKSICLLSAWLAGGAFINPVQATQPSVTVQSYAKHAGPNTVYTYRVTNHGPDRLFRFTIGCNCHEARLSPDSPPVPEDDGPELVIFPVNFTFGGNYCDGEVRVSSCGTTAEDSYSAPAGWYGGVEGYEGTDYISFGFDTPSGTGISLLPGYTATFSITTPTIEERDYFLSWKENLKATAGMEYFYDKNRRGYLTGHYSYRKDIPNGGNRVVSYPMELIDKTPPTLSITLNPATLWPPNNKPMLVNATITTGDDYDPEPEIKLESITANEPLAGGDIQNAQIGTDDRDFYLAAKRAGNNMAGRIYTITYSATDASGNKATASATVAVQHDQGR
ncbi:MAG: hypothetical protein A3H99_10410 [Gallionellales bacterium RIFCSPLOWO2_02_FULL_59_110]|nr:MAG: hypothetical protein A3H99_10410 [Gallionellales bacterium RIFCSPLOWO2_02_FULL_59_110]